MAAALHALTQGGQSLRVGWRSSNRRAYSLRHLCRIIILRDGAARKNIHVRHKIALYHTPYHEHFDTLSGRLYLATT